MNNQVKPYNFKFRTNFNLGRYEETKHVFITYNHKLEILDLDSIFCFFISVIQDAIEGEQVELSYNYNDIEFNDQ